MLCVLSGRKNTAGVGGPRLLDAAAVGPQERLEGALRDAEAKREAKEREWLCAVGQVVSRRRLHLHGCVVVTDGGGRLGGP